ncbi:cytochrome P450 [Hypoxylon sp. FL1150]|nr:cytochrome P450 [Hypoxylon sp. FL1150]
MPNLPNLSSWRTLVAPVTIYFATLAFYHLFLHPLTRFPGPKLAIVSRQYTFQIKEMHKKYGPIVRISPYDLHINDAIFFEKLYGYDGPWEKYPCAIYTHSAPGAMNVKSLDSVERIAEFAGTGRVLDMGAAISAFQHDVSTDYVLGKDHQYLEGDIAAGKSPPLQNTVNRWQSTKHVPWYGSALLVSPQKFLIRRAAENTAKFIKYIKTSLEETQRLMQIATSFAPDDREPRTIVHEIVNSSLPQEEKTMKRIFTDVATVTGAGFETTASALRLIIYHVSSDDAPLKRLRDELDQAAANEPSGNLALRTYEKLSFLNAVLMEGLRLSPGIGGRSPGIAPNRELLYDKWQIPAGTPVGMAVLMIHLDETLYPDPYRFNPERWMHPDARRKSEKTFAPFSRGSRMCLGMHLAWAELYLVISSLVRKFDFDFVGVDANHFEWASDQFTIGIKGRSEVGALVLSRGT